MAAEKSDRLRPIAFVRLGPALAFILLLLVVPLIATAYLSLQPNVLLSFDPPSLANYRYLLGVPYYYAVLLRTLRTALVSTAAALAIGYPAAYMLKTFRRASAER